jgi:hypothetical protein
VSARDEIISRVVDTIWTELERQAERFGCVDRERSLIDMGAIELDMAKVAAAALKPIECDQVDDVARRYMDEIGWW